MTIYEFFKKFPDEEAVKHILNPKEIIRESLVRDASTKMIIGYLHEININAKSVTIEPH